MAEQLTLNQWVLGSSPRGRTSKKIPLILRNRRDFCVPRIDTFLRLEVHIILFASGFDAWKTVFALVPTGDPSSQSSDTLMSLRAIPSCLAWLPGAAAEDICTCACIGIRGTLRSRRGCGRCAVVQCVRPVPSELGRGRAVAVWSVA